jgi:hypothetical protein
MTAFFLIFLNVNFETSYDAFNTKADRIYRVVTDIKTPSDMLHWSSTSAPMIVSMSSQKQVYGNDLLMSFQYFLFSILAFLAQH